MKSKLCRFQTLVALWLVSLVLPAHLAVAKIGDPAPSSSLESADPGCGSVDTAYMSGEVIRSIVVRVCEECRFSEADRYALLYSYGTGARDAGYIVDPLNSSVLEIMETGTLPDGRPYVVAEIEGKEVQIRARSTDAVASAAAEAALAIVTGDQQ